MVQTLEKPVLGTREANMQRRRDRILKEARRMIADGGYDALSTRALAKAAGVSQPTLYNLIGSKDEIVMELVMAAIERIEERLSFLEDRPPLERAEAVVTQSTGLFETDETFYKAAFIAIDRMAMASDQLSPALTVVDRSVQMAAGACRAAEKKGLLRGNIPSRILGEQMYINYYTPFRNWVLGQIDLNEFRRIALRGFYMCMSVDAIESFRETLIGQINQLNNPQLESAE